MEYIDSWKIVQLDTINRLAVKVYGSGFKYFDKAEMESKLGDFQLENTVIDIIPTTEVDLEKYQSSTASLPTSDLLREPPYSLVKRIEMEIHPSITNILSYLSDLELQSA